MPQGGLQKGTANGFALLDRSPLGIGSCQFAQKMRGRYGLSEPPRDCIEPSVSRQVFFPSSLRSRRTCGVGVIAQLGERFNGIEEVGGSIPPGSTTQSFDF